MKTKTKLGRFCDGLLTYIPAILMTCIFIYPLYFVLVSSFKSNAEIFTTPFSLPTSFHFENYETALKIGNVARQLGNSMILSVSSVLLTILVSSMISFALTRLRFKAAPFFTVYFMIGMMVPIQSIIIAISFMASTFNLRDNYLIVILLYTGFYTPLSTVVITGFMKGIPTALEEAAVIDGCSIYRTFASIFLPLLKPAIATVSVFVFMYTWNDLLTPLVLLGKNELTTISVGLVNFVGARRGDYGALMAAILISVLPTLLMYILMQENVEKGLTSGAVK